MDALELLKKDHDTVKELFEKAEGNNNEKQQKRLFEQIKRSWKLTRTSRRRFFIPRSQKLMN